MLDFVVAITYELVVWLFNSIITTFFRDIEVRGSFNIPKSGAVIFVIAPHHNQFMDGCVVISKVKKYSSRRISFLIAGKSYRRPLIGFFSRLTGAIPVERAQDLLGSAHGKIYLGESDTEIVGDGTKFKSDCHPKGLIGLPNSLANGQIAEIVSDTKLVLKKSLFDGKTEKAAAAIAAALKDGTPYKVAPHVDNHKLFSNVFEYLNKNKVLGLFPEGGSHDRTDLLPLKPGVAIMALGAVATSADPDQVINIIPVGMNYFHPNKFRSRAVIEFGEPIKITKEHGKRYEEDSRKEVDRLLQTITYKLKEVTVTCDDYETLILLQAVRRLYTSGQRESIPLPLVIEMNRRLIKGYNLNKNNADVMELKNLVMDYNKKLQLYGLHDHQVESLTKSNRISTFVTFCDRLFKMFLFVGLSLPGVFLFSPVFIIGNRISRIKQKEALEGSVVKIKAVDVVATWKVMVALVVAPALYIFWSICGTTLIIKLGILPDNFSRIVIFVVCYLWSVLTTYASLRIGEIGVDYYKSLRPLFYSIISSHIDIVQIEDLKKNRRFLSDQVGKFCDKYGPSIFDDYDAFYKDYNKVADEHELSTVPQYNSFNLSDLADVPIFSYIAGSDDEPTPDVSNKVHEAMIRRRKND